MQPKARLRATQLGENALSQNLVGLVRRFDPQRQRLVLRAHPIEMNHLLADHRLVWPPHEGS